MNHQPNTPASLNEAVADPVLRDVCSRFLACIGPGGYYPQAGKPLTDELRTALAAPGAAIDAREQEVPSVLPKGDLSKVWLAADDVCEWLNYEVWPEKSLGLKKSVDVLSDEMMRAEIRASRATPSEALSPATVAQPVADRDALMKLSQFAHTAAHMSERECRNNLLSIADQLIALASRVGEAPAGYLPIPEDATERRYFDLATETYGGDVRANINLTLRQFAKQFPASSSLACTLNIIANEVLRLHRATPSNKQEKAHD